MGLQEDHELPLGVRPLPSETLLVPLSGQAVQCGGSAIGGITAAIRLNLKTTTVVWDEFGDPLPTVSNPCMAEAISARAAVLTCDAEVADMNVVDVVREQIIEDCYAQ